MDTKYCVDWLGTLTLGSRQSAPCKHECAAHRDGKRSGLLSSAVKPFSVWMM
jgi:hypothetical protein